MYEQILCYFYQTIKTNKDTIKEVA